jgi:hypothetical protein
MKPIDFPGMLILLLSRENELRKKNSISTDCELQVSEKRYSIMCNEALAMQPKFYNPYSGNPWNLKFLDHPVNINPKLSGYSFLFCAKSKAKQRHAS